MTRWFPLEPVDESFLTAARHRLHLRVDTPLPAATVWQSLAADDSIAAWGPGIAAVRWLDPRPFGVGTRREVVLPAGAVTVRERFFRWDDDGDTLRRSSFYVEQSNRPGLRAFAEDWRVTATPGGSRIDWRVALEAAPKAGPAVAALVPGLRLAFGRVARSGERYYARQARAGA